MAVDLSVSPAATFLSALSKGAADMAAKRAEEEQKEKEFNQRFQFFLMGAKLNQIESERQRTFLTTEREAREAAGVSAFKMQTTAARDVAIDRRRFDIESREDEQAARLELAQLGITARAEEAELGRQEVRQAAEVKLEADVEAATVRHQRAVDTAETLLQSMTALKQQGIDADIGAASSLVEAQKQAAETSNANKIEAANVQRDFLEKQSQLERNLRLQIAGLRAVDGVGGDASLREKELWKSYQAATQDFGKLVISLLELSETDPEALDRLQAAADFEVAIAQQIADIIGKPVPAHQITIPRFEDRQWPRGNVGKRGAFTTEQIMVQPRAGAATAPTTPAITPTTPELQGDARVQEVIEKIQADLQASGQTTPTDEQLALIQGGYGLTSEQTDAVIAAITPQPEAVILQAEAVQPSIVVPEEPDQKIAEAVKEITKQVRELEGLGLTVKSISLEDQNVSAEEFGLTLEEYREVLDTVGVDYEGKTSTLEPGRLERSSNVPALAPSRRETPAPKLSKAEKEREVIKGITKPKPKIEVPPIEERKPGDLSKRDLVALAKEIRASIPAFYQVFSRQFLDGLARQYNLTVEEMKVVVKEGGFVVRGEAAKKYGGD